MRGNALAQKIVASDIALDQTQTFYTPLNGNTYIFLESSFPAF